MVSLCLSLCLLAISLESSLAYQVDGGSVTTERGVIDGSEKCNRQYCPSSEATCIDNRCTCNDGTVGVGGLGCYGDGYKTCAMTSDVNAKTFQHDHVEVPSPCRYTLTQYRIQKPNGRKPNDKCIVTIWATNVRYEGKLFVGEFDVMINVLPDGQEEAYLVQFAGFGEVDEATGDYTFQRRVRVDSTYPWHELDDETVDYDYTFEVDDTNKRLRFEFPYCGLKLNFRPAHPTEGKDQSYLPGVNFAIDHELGYVQYLQEQSMCINPPDDGPSTAEVIDGVGFPGEPDLAFSKISLSENKNKEWFMSDACNKLKTEVSSCTDEEMTEATEICTTLLTQETFVACYSRDEPAGDTDAIVYLMKSCINAVCSQDVGACNDVKEDVMGTCPNDLSGVVLATHNCNDL